MTCSTPAAIEEDDLARRGQVLHVALEIPLTLLTIARRAERHDATGARIHRLGEALARAALPRGVTTLEETHNLETPLLGPELELHQLLLESFELFLVVLLLDLLVVDLELVVSGVVVF